MKLPLFALAASAALLLLPGCQTLPSIDEAARQKMLQEIQTEAPGPYYIGRRYYKVDYKFWGYIRKPGEPWSSAKMVMLNENTRLAPDREGGTLGSDNGYEYKLFGSFSGDTVYEPASNDFYPEFVLKRYELRSKNPGPIFHNPAAAGDPGMRIILSPF